MFTDALLANAESLLKTCRGKGLKLAVAESCTGGLISALLTEIPGSSDVFERGFVTYSYESKTELLGVDKAELLAHGAVSERVVSAMAMGAKGNAGVDIAIAVSGIAGPGGGTKEKPVGTVYIAIAAGERLTVERCQFKGNRSQIRLSSVEKALAMLGESLKLSFVSVA